MIKYEAVLKVVSGLVVIPVDAIPFIAPQYIQRVERRWVICRDGKADVIVHDSVVGAVRKLGRIDNCGKITAIKLLKELYDLSLTEAKEFVDAVVDQVCC